MSPGAIVAVAVGVPFLVVVVAVGVAVIRMGVQAERDRRYHRERLYR